MTYFLKYSLTLVFTLYYLLFGVSSSSQTVNKDEIIVRDILTESKKVYEKIIQGEINYEIHDKYTNNLDTFFYKIELKFYRKCAEDTHTNMLLEIAAKERRKDTLHLRRSLYKKKAYFSSNYTFAKQTRKSFYQNTSSLYKHLPAIYHASFFNSLGKDIKTLRETEQHYIIDTPQKVVYINKESKLITRVTYRGKSDDGINYQDINIYFQDYTVSNLDDKTLYQLRKNKNRENRELPQGKSSMHHTKAPDWKCLDVKTGEWLELNDLRGKVIVLDFWYTSCGPCINFLPKMKQLQETFKENNEVVFVGMAWDKHAENVLKHLEKYAGGVFYTNVLCGEKELNAYQVKGMPDFFIIGKNLEIIYKKNNTLGAKRSLKKHIKKALRQH